MRYPDDYIWGYPGFPSLTVPYGMANDFHFPVHLSILIIAANEMWEEQHYLWSKAALMTLIYQTVIISATRGAYSIDLVAAYLFGHFHWLLATKLCYYIDVLVFGNSF